MEKSGHEYLLLDWRDFLDTAISEEQLKAAVNKGTCNKAPRKYGVYPAFLNVNC
jgi:hypothetical protein